MVKVEEFSQNLRDLVEEWESANAMPFEIDGERILDIEARDT